MFFKFNPKEKFDFSVKPIKPRWYLMLVEWVGTLALCSPLSATVKKLNCRGLKPPYLLLASHASFRDFPMAVRAMFPHRSHWVISVEEFAGREWLMRSIGGIGKRKFTQQLSLVRQIMTVLKKYRLICTIYPEARFSLIGINEQLDGALGKLARQCQVPVVVYLQHGNFLQSPQWCKRPYRRVRSEGEFIQVVTREEAKTLSAAEIQKRIEDAFVYDDYAWQKENRVRITSKYRAHHLHRVLYQCPVCGQEFAMNSHHTELWCESCGARWRMSEYGELERQDGEDIFRHPPDWYRWQRQNVEQEVQSGNYCFEDEARLEHLVSSRHKFKAIGTVRLRHDYDGFTVTGTLDDGREFRLHRTPRSMMSCHIEYNFKGRGDALDLATADDTYWLFPLTARNPLTKLHFAAEAMHRYSLEQKPPLGKQEQL